MPDLVKRLREDHYAKNLVEHLISMCLEAADRIEELERRIEELKRMYDERLTDCERACDRIEDLKAECTGWAETATTQVIRIDSLVEERNNLADERDRLKEAVALQLRHTLNSELPRAVKDYTLASAALKGETSDD